MNTPTATEIDLGPSSLTWTTADKLLNLLCQASGAGRMVRRIVPDELRSKVHARRVLSLASRRYFNDVMLPAFFDEARRILFVGVDRYTQSYARHATARGVEFLTLDNNPDMERYAEPGRHTQGDFLAVDPTAMGPFDAVLFNGMFGYGINDTPAMEQALEIIAGLLPPDGLLLLGWNQGLAPDPYTLAGVERWFRTAELSTVPARCVFPGETHTYDLLRRR